MPEPFALLILFLAGGVAGFINVMAGGGSTLTMPALIFLGLDSIAANGTNRLAIFVQNVFAIASFRGEDVHDFKTSLKLSLFTLPGAVLGAWYANVIDDAAFRVVLAVVMIGVVVSTFIPQTRKNNLSDEAGPPRFAWLVYPAMFLIGFYGGFIQMGVGFILIAAMYHLMRLPLLYVNMHKVFIVFIYTIPAFAIFIFKENVVWKYGLALAAGNALGAWWSAKVSVKKGEKVIRVVLLVAVVLMALKLLGVY